MDVTRKYYLFGRDTMVRNLDIPLHGTVLEVGCGTGRNLLMAARAEPTARCYGFDISQQMLTSAENAVQKAGLTNRVKFAIGDAASFDAKAAFSTSGFDRVYLSYCLSMIPNWTTALEQALRQVSPKGSVHVVDFGRMEQWPGFARRMLWNWLDQFSVSPRTDLVPRATAIADRHGCRSRVRSIGRGYACLLVLERTEG